MSSERDIFRTLFSFFISPSCASSNKLEWSVEMNLFLQNKMIICNFSICTHTFPRRLKMCERENINSWEKFLTHSLARDVCKYLSIKKILSFCLMTSGLLLLSFVSNKNTHFFRVRKEITHKIENETINNNKKKSSIEVRWTSRFVSHNFGLITKFTLFSAPLKTKMSHKLFPEQKCLNDLFSFFGDDVIMLSREGKKTLVLNFISLSLSRCLLHFHLRIITCIELN